MQLSLAKLPWYAQVGAFVALAVGAAGAFEYYYGQPMRTDLDGKRAQLMRLRADVTKGLNTARQLPEFEKEVANLEARLANLRAVLPEEKDAADLLRRMQTEATQSNLVIKSFKPAPVVTRQLHAEWPISLELEGTYHDLAMFFDRIGKFTRIVNITGLDVKGRDRAGDVNATITATCIATTFVLLDKPATPAGRGARPAGRGAPPPRKAA
jgi:type IV pilus assembly protein PilO